MAVYKPTLCSPFLHGLDARIGYHTDFSSAATLIQYLTCNIDTSNKNITGYKIRLLDSNNTQIFPLEDHEQISPISELQALDSTGQAKYGYVTNGVNSGINGTVLQVPFFQNVANITNNKSYNNIYYSDKYLADHIIFGDTVAYKPRALTDMEKLSNWTLSNDTLTYNWPGGSAEEKIANAITLDGDRVLNGEIILVVNGDVNAADGLWVATFKDSELVLTRADTTVILYDRVTVLQGDTFHNTSWKCTAQDTQSRQAFEYVSTGGVWTDDQSSVVTGFSCNDETFKWEITLYQGNGVLSSDDYGSYITYTDVSPEWLDMTLTTGKIMGTTAERIQIGGVPYTTITEGVPDFNYATAVVPEGTDSDPLVLQGKYIELSAGTYPTAIMSGNTRVYIKTYDATYGHAYPLTNSLNATIAKEAKYCQCFEHSNDPDDILDTDIINYTFTSYLPIEFYSVSNNVWTKQDADTIESISVTQRRLVIGTGSTVQGGITSGDLILLSNQVKKDDEGNVERLEYQNGVYTYFTSYGTLEGTTTQVKFHCIKRASAYDTWANYIGKILYSLTGDNVSRCNMESLAMAGAYTLWNPLNTTSGFSPLYFTQERPIILFRNRLDHSFQLFDKDSSHSEAETTISKHQIDGISISVGNIILYNDGYYGTVSYADNETYKLQSDSIKPVSINDYIYIINGSTLGGLVFKWPTAAGVAWSEPTENWDLYTGVVLQNTTSRTFISPWTGLQENMKLCLLNNKTISYQSNPDVLTKWITIKNNSNAGYAFNDKIYCIEHAALTTALSSEDNDDESVPWQYDIRYFFKTSDENPFYAYETPYIRLYKNGSLYSDISKVGALLAYGVKNTDSGASKIVYNVIEDATTTPVTYEEFDVAHFVSLAQITGRSVKLGAEYKQFGESSWESYEWILYNQDGDVVQDTGKCYDKTMDVTFYGLANDGSSTVQYTAKLLIENDYGDTLSYSLTLHISPGEASQFLSSGNFTATMDCEMQAVKLNISGLDLSTESYSIYRREYEIYQRPGYRLEGYYCAINDVQQDPDKWGKFYVQNDYSEEINPKMSNFVYVDKDTGFTYKYMGADAYPEFLLVDAFRSYKGEWTPVLLKTQKSELYDYNISNHRSYQYIIYPGESQIEKYGLDSLKQTFANYEGQIWYTNPTYSNQGKIIEGTRDNSTINGEPITTNWQYWSITELIPEEVDVDAPIMKNKYRADYDNIWLFKYSLDTGAQTQNFTKNEIQTLGQFPKYGYSAANTDSGSVSALLGSEIILASKGKYTERLRQSRITPLSTNEATEMLKKWKQLCFSKNPKLLKDIKGQSWIVQVTSNTNTPDNFILNNPDTISFSWKQVESPENVVIYSDVDDSIDDINDAYGNMSWIPLYQE